MKHIVFLMVACLLWFSGCAKPNTHFIRIESTPPEALLTIHKTEGNPSPETGIITGITPYEGTLDFGKTGKIWMELDKRGYQHHIKEITQDMNPTSVTLKTAKDAKGNDIKGAALKDIHKILLAPPSIKVIERGFSTEKVSEEKSDYTESAVADGAISSLANTHKVTRINVSKTTKKPLKSLWRDVRSAIELLNPAKIRFTTVPPCLETTSSRKAARQLGKKLGGDAILFITGKQNQETAGMAVGKAVVESTGKFLHNQGIDTIVIKDIHIPYLYLKGALIHCDTGEILWTGTGVWGQIMPDVLATLNH